MEWLRRGCDVDVHVLVHHGVRRPDWLDRCLASLAACDVNVLLVREPGENIGAARAAAFAACRAPFVAGVDDDDCAGDTAAFTACAGALSADDDLAGVYTAMVHVGTDGRRRLLRRLEWHPEMHLGNPLNMLHLRVMRRAAVMACVDELRTWPVLVDLALNVMLMRHGDWHRVGALGYIKHEHKSGVSWRIPTTAWTRYRQLAHSILEARK